MAKKYVNPTKVVTGECRFSYANLWEAKAMDENSKPKYSVSLIIPKSDTKTIAKIKAAIEAAYEEGKSKLSNGKSVPSLSSIKTPLRDGDTDRPDDEAYANSYFVNANSITAPGIVDADRQQILTHSEIYSGIYGRASITFYVGGANYQVPLEVSPARRETLGLRWLTAYSRSRGEKTMAQRLAAEIMDAANNTGNAVKKREDTHKMAEANKAFAHFRY